MLTFETFQGAAAVLVAVELIFTIGSDLEGVDAKCQELKKGLKYERIESR